MSSIITSPSSDQYYSQISQAKANTQSLEEFSKLLNSATLITTAADSKSHKPSVDKFMNSTGANFFDASELLYGVTGDKDDTRNWQEIMNSLDPLSYARAATAKMYGGESTAYPTSTTASNGNYAIIQESSDQNQAVSQSFKIVSSSGEILRDAGTSAQQIARNAWLFGLDVATALPLVEQAKDISPSLSNEIKKAQTYNLKSEDQPNIDTASTSSVAASARLASQSKSSASAKEYLNIVLAHMK